MLNQILSIAFSATLFVFLGISNELVSFNAQEPMIAECQPRQAYPGFEKPSFRSPTFVQFADPDGWAQSPVNYSLESATRRYSLFTYHYKRDYRNLSNAIELSQILKTYCGLEGNISDKYVLDMMNEYDLFEQFDQKPFLMPITQRDWIPQKDTFYQTYVRSLFLFEGDEVLAFAHEPYYELLHLPLVKGDSGTGKYDVLFYHRIWIVLLTASCAYIVLVAGLLWRFRPWRIPPSMLLMRGAMEVMLHPPIMDVENASLTKARMPTSFQEYVDCNGPRPLTPENNSNLIEEA